MNALLIRLAYRAAIVPLTAIEGWLVRARNAIRAWDGRPPL